MRHIMVLRIKYARVLCKRKKWLRANVEKKGEKVGSLIFINPRGVFINRLCELNADRTYYKRCQF